MSGEASHGQGILSLGHEHHLALLRIGDDDQIVVAAPLTSPKTTVASTPPTASSLAACSGLSRRLPPSFLATLVQPGPCEAVLTASPLPAPLTAGRLRGMVLRSHQEMSSHNPIGHTPDVSADLPPTHFSKEAKNLVLFPNGSGTVHNRISAVYESERHYSRGLKV